MHFHVLSAALPFFRWLITSFLKICKVSDISLNVVSVVAYTSVLKVTERISSLMIAAAAFIIRKRSVSGFCSLCSYQALLRILNPVSFKQTTDVFPWYWKDDLMSIPAHNDTGYTVQCDLKYPENLHSSADCEDILHVFEVAYQWNIDIHHFHSGERTT